MKKLLPKSRPTLAGALLPTAIAIVCATNVAASEAQYSIRPTPGGLSPTPDITSMASTNREVTVKWHGFGGPYQLEKLPQLGGQWEPVGNATSQKQLTVPGTESHAFFRVRGANPAYAGSETCAECHGTTAHHWSQSGHAHALQTLADIGMGANAACLKCHTVGSGLPGGFNPTGVTAATLANVQCESCHGPAGLHASNPDDPLTRPTVTQSANLCGGCHDGEHHPTFTEWRASLHSRVDPHVGEGMEDPATSTGRMNSCGACHSGAVRAAMLKTVGGAALQLPSGHEAASTGVTCSTCHASHQSPTAASLRNPQFSTNFFALSSSTNFAVQYDANVQICGQCHNTRGAGPNDSSRPPHHSPQYNVLIGDIGTAKGNAPATIHSRHTTLSKQCSSCHLHRSEPEVVSAESPAYTGHDFAASLQTCTGCHESVTRAEELVAGTQLEIRGRIAEVKQLLDSWGETKAPEALRTKYGKLAWEYTTSGQLSNPTGDATIKGPSSAEQSTIPAEIKKARFWLYMIEHDGSFGVHNPKFARSILDEAETTVTTVLNAP